MFDLIGVLNRFLLTCYACFQIYELLTVNVKSHPHLIQEVVVLLFVLLGVKAIETRPKHVRVTYWEILDLMPIFDAAILVI